ncbi:MAG: hypothetical protein HQL50_16360 [Magnetococcales bacterium]|nr:hypothetical protein [Magnetococcales bacterium]
MNLRRNGHHTLLDSRPQEPRRTRLFLSDGLAVAGGVLHQVTPLLNHQESLSGQRPFS